MKLTDLVKLTNKQTTGKNNGPLFLRLWHPELCILKLCILELCILKLRILELSC